MQDNNTKRKYEEVQETLTTNDVSIIIWFSIDNKWPEHLKNRAAHLMIINYKCLSTYGHFSIKKKLVSFDWFHNQL